MSGPDINLRSFASVLRDQARVSRHRNCIVVSGDRAWCRETAAALTVAWDEVPVTWVTDEATAPVGTALPAARARRSLGTEVGTAVFDARDSFDANALGAVGGTVRGGGLLIMITPPLADWLHPGDEQPAATSSADFYLVRAAGLLQESGDISLLQQHRPLPPLPQSIPVEPPPRDDSLYLSAEQKTAVEAVIHVVEGQRKRPAILVSDRGRGKSSALGIAAGLLLQRGSGRIVVTGHRERAVEQVFIQAKRLAPDSEAELRFLAPDRLLREQVELELLLVDEAAAIPLFQLQALLHRYPRIAFATTVHGYEGTGRGFLLKFLEIARKHSRGCTRVTLQQPVRWAPDDPLERFLGQLLMLDAEPSPVNESEDETGAPAGELTIRQVRPSQLCRDERLLRQVYGMLVSAHYRTTPSDLQYLLGGMDLDIFCQYQGTVVAAVALVCHEGRLDPALAGPIWLGRSRPQGHLLPQVLSQHLGIYQAPLMHCARVMRIAVHPRLQGQGIGSHLLDWLGRHYQEHCDLIGASFGVSPELQKFWHGSGFSTARIGLHQSGHSGAAACLVITGLSERGRRCEAEARRHLHDNLPLQLRTILASLPAEVVRETVRSLPPVDDPFTENRRALGELAAFALGHRLPETLPTVLQKFVLYGLEKDWFREMEWPRVQLLIEHVLQGKDWKECAALQQHDGRSRGVEMMRGAVREVLESEFPMELETILTETGCNGR